MAWVLLGFAHAFLSPTNALLCFPSFCSSLNVNSRVKSAAKWSVMIPEPIQGFILPKVIGPVRSSAESLVSCSVLGLPSAPLHWAGNFRTVPFLLFWKCPPCQLALSLRLLVSERDLTKDWIAFTCRYRPHHCEAMLALSGHHLKKNKTWLSKLSTVFSEGFAHFSVRLTIITTLLNMATTSVISLKIYARWKFCSLWYGIMCSMTCIFMKRRGHC